MLIYKLNTAPSMILSTINHLTGLSRLQLPLAVHQDEVFVHLRWPGFGKSTPRKPTVERLYPPHMPMVKWRYNRLSIVQFLMALPGHAFTQGALVIRHDDTSVFIHERAINMLQDNNCTGRPCSGAILNRPMINIVDSV